MFGIGGVEFILILLFVFIIFGADRLPEIARVLGKAIAKFRKAQAEMNAAIQTDVKNLETDEQPFQKSVEAFDKFGKEAATAVKETVSGVQKTNEVKYGKAGVSVASAAGAAAANAAHEAAQGVAEPEEKKPEAKPISASVGTAAGSGIAATASVAPTATVTAPAPRRESFTERKARYEAERAARAAAEAAKAAEAEAAAAAPEAAAPSGEGE